MARVVPRGRGARPPARGRLALLASCVFLAALYLAASGGSLSVSQPTAAPQQQRPHSSSQEEAVADPQPVPAQLQQEPAQGTQQAVAAAAEPAAGTQRAVAQAAWPAAAQRAVSEAAWTAAAGRWKDAPAMELQENVPEWMRCARKPCTFTHMESGAVDTTEPWVSQFGEDVWLFNNLFYNKRNGFYLEMGAMEGTDLSNTRWLMKAANWTGLLIEACPAMAEGLMNNRPESIDVHAAVCGEFRTVHWLSSGNVGGIVEFMAQNFKDIYHKDLDQKQLVEMPCVPMQYLLDRYGIATVDLWSLDVEGAELEVLKTVDFNRFYAHAIMIELDGHAPEKDLAVVELLAKQDYVKLPKTQENDMNNFNTVFVHKDAWPHLAHAPHITEVTQ